MARILLIEDNIDTARLVTWRLSREGFDVEHLSLGGEAFAAASRDIPALIILDWMLPDMDGLEVCRQLRQIHDGPILMLTANGEVEDRIRGLESGASDYLPKPFELEELVARVKAQIRLARPQPKTRLEFADLVLDTRRYEVSRGDRAIALTPKEFELLHYLLREPQRVVSRDRLLETVWGHDFDGDARILDVFMSTLRKKVDVPPEPKLIHTVRGVGYQLRQFEA